MEAIDIKRLEEAVISFYRSTSQEQAVTHAWLTKIQASPQAWSFSWELMRPEKPQEVQFFGAITLHSKLMKHWQEVPVESREELKQKILETLLSFSNGPKMILLRLCVALSAYIVHMVNEWPTAIEDVINTFQNQQIPHVTRDMQLWIMFEVLQAIPIEGSSIFTSVKRVTLRGEISKRTPCVMQTIENYLEHRVNCNWSKDDFANMVGAVKCVGQWVKNLGYQIDKCHKIAEVLVKLINKSYWPCVQESDGCMSADENDLAEYSIKALINIMIQPESHNYPKSAFALIKLFIESLSDITKAEWKQDNNNEDIIVNIYTLIISSIERHAQLLLTGITTSDSEHAELYRRVVSEILQCTDKPGIYPVEESCSSLAMGFWYMLQDEIFSIQDTEEKNKCWQLIKPVYAHLTQILVRKAQQPDESSIDGWNDDDFETFRCYRQDISDTLMYCYDVLHSYTLDVLACVLEEAITEIQTNPTAWTKLEACVFAFYSVSEHVENAETVHIPKLMQVLNSIPYDRLNDKLLGTALEAVGSYCVWFQGNPNYIASAIQLLLKGLNSPMSSQATLGLKDLCRDCQIQMKPFSEPVLAACQSSLSNGQLKNSDAVRLMFSVGKLMSMLPAEKIPKYLDMIVSPCFEELQVICQSQAKTQPSKIRSIFRLNMISTLFASLNTDVEDDNNIESSDSIQPVLIVMQRTMPLFRSIAELWINEIEVIEAACNALKYAINNLGSDFKPMLEDLCYFIVAIFQNKPCPPALEVSKTCIVIFYKDMDSKGLMHQLLSQVILYTFQLFELTPDAGFSNIAETVESFYLCIVSILKKHPAALAEANVDLNKLVFYGLKAITLPENGPIKCGVQFLQHFIVQSQNFPLMTRTVLDQGEEIVRTTLLCVGCHTPRAQVEKFADVFLALNKKYPAEMVGWLKMLSTPNFPTQVIDQADKMKFMSQILKEKNNKRLIQSYLNDFAAKARGLVEKV